MHSLSLIKRNIHWIEPHKFLYRMNLLTIQIDWYWSNIPFTIIMHQWLQPFCFHSTQALDTYSYQGLFNWEIFPSENFYRNFYKAALCLWLTWYKPLKYKGLPLIRSYVYLRHKANLMTSFIKLLLKLSGYLLR